MEIYLVGGAVRDELLKQEVKDRDWVVVGATPADLLKQGYKQVGKDFPVFLHPDTKEEHALARTETKSGKGYGGFICDFNPSVTLEEDLKRRDLTINAIAKSEEGEIVDPYNGVRDIQLKQLRHVSEAFGEDPLRILRVARFAARYHHLGFSIANETLQLMTEMCAADVLSELTAERVWLETQKAIVEPNPEIYFQTLQQCNGTHPWFSPWQEVMKSDSAKKKLSTDLLHCIPPNANNATFLRLTVWSYLFLPAAANFFKSLKASKDYLQFNKLISQHQSLMLNNTQPNAIEVYTLLKNINGYRQPEILNLFIQVFELISQTLKQEHFNYEILSQALSNTLKINADSFIQQGIQGAELGKAIEEHRINSINALLTKLAN